MVATETVCPLNPRSSQFLNGKNASNFAAVDEYVASRGFPS